MPGHNKPWLLYTSYTRIPKAADWSRINLRLIDEELDLAGWDVDSFNRRLDMKEGIF